MHQYAVNGRVLIEPVHERQEIGLGNATAIESITIDWPVSRKRQVIKDVPLDSMIRVTEGNPGFERLPLSSASLTPKR